MQKKLALEKAEENEKKQDSYKYASPGVVEGVFKGIEADLGDMSKLTPEQIQNATKELLGIGGNITTLKALDNIRENIKVELSYDKRVAEAHARADAEAQDRLNWFKPKETLKQSPASDWGSEESPKQETIPQTKKEKALEEARALYSTKTGYITLKNDVALAQEGRLVRNVSGIELTKEDVESLYEEIKKEKEEGWSETEKEWFAKGERGEVPETAEMKQGGILKRGLDKLKSLFARDKEKAEQAMDNKQKGLLEKFRENRVMLTAALLFLFLVPNKSDTIQSESNEPGISDIKTPDSGTNKLDTEAPATHSSEKEDVLKESVLKEGVLKAGSSDPEKPDEDATEGTPEAATKQVVAEEQPKTPEQAEPSPEKTAEPYTTKNGDGLIRVLKGLELDKDRDKVLWDNIDVQTGYAETDGKIDVPGSTIHMFRPGVEYRIQDNRLELKTELGEWTTAIPDYTVSGQARKASLETEKQPETGVVEKGKELVTVTESFNANKTTSNARNVLAALSQFIGANGGVEFINQTALGEISFETVGAAIQTIAADQAYSKYPGTQKVLGDWKHHVQKLKERKGRDSHIPESSSTVNITIPRRRRKE